MDFSCDFAFLQGRLQRIRVFGTEFEVLDLVFYQKRPDILSRHEADMFDLAMLHRDGFADGLVLVQDFDARNAGKAVFERG